ncbi:unnamed protein product, partial [marine sediment metagenome]
FYVVFIADIQFGYENHKETKMTEDIRETIKTKLLDNIINDRTDDVRSKIDGVTYIRENRHQTITNFKTFIEALAIEASIGK